MIGRKGTTRTTRAVAGICPLMESNSSPGVLRTINDAFTLLRVVVGAWTAASFVSLCKSASRSERWRLHRR
jgi:hypothetical protein